MDSHPSNRSYTIAEARQNLPALVHLAEESGPISLTRRGKPVAVLLSHDEYAELQTRRPSWWEEIKECRRSGGFQEGLTFEEVDSWRDRSPARPVDL